MVGVGVMALYDHHEEEPGAIVLEDEPFDVVRSKSSESFRRTPGNSNVSKASSILRHRARTAAAAATTAGGVVPGKTIASSGTASYDVGDLPALSRSGGSGGRSTEEVDNTASSRKPQTPEDDSTTALTRNVTGGRSTHTRPLSPPSRAGLDDPETYQQRRRRHQHQHRKGGRDDADDDDDYDDDDEDTEEPGGSSTIGSSSAYTGTATNTSSGGTGSSTHPDEMPEDEARDYEDEMKALALCDYGEGSQGMPEFCETAMQAVNQMCAGGGAGAGAASPERIPATAEEEEEEPSSPGRRKSRWPGLKLGDKHRSEATGVEEHTAIEVEYVEPAYRGKNDPKASPKRKNALLKAMTRRARDDYKTGRGGGGSVSSGKKTPQQEQQGATAEVSGDVYATFTNAEKRKFLQLINGGISPFDATNRVLRERPEGGGGTVVSNDGSSVYSFQSSGAASPTRSVTTKPAAGSAGRKAARKLAFWKRKSKDSPAAVAASSPRQQQQQLQPQEPREQLIVSPPGTPRRYAGGGADPSGGKERDDGDDDDSDSSCENVGEEIKKFLRDEAASQTSSKHQEEEQQRRRRKQQQQQQQQQRQQQQRQAKARGDEGGDEGDDDDDDDDDHRFEKSGINYYDAVRKNDEPEEEDNAFYYNGSEYPPDDPASESASGRRGSSRRIKMPFQGSLRKLRDRNRATPVPEEEEEEDYDDADDDDREVERIASSSSATSPRGVLESHVSINSPPSKEEDVRVPTPESDRRAADDEDERAAEDRRSPKDAAAVAPQSSFNDEEKKTEEQDDPRGAPSSSGGGGGGAIEEAIAARLKGVESHPMQETDGGGGAAEGGGDDNAKSAEEIVEDLNMDAYLGNQFYHSDTASRGAGGGGSGSNVNSQSFDGTSVVSGRSYKTTNTTVSTRSRRPGQAKIRLEQERSFVSNGGGSIASSGANSSLQQKSWQQSIEEVAAKLGREWDPVNGWKGYVDPKRLENGTSADDFYSDSVADFTGEATTQVVLSDPAQLTEWRDTQRKMQLSRDDPITSSGSVQRNPNRPRRSPPQKVASPPRDDKPRGWAATMKAATAKLNLQGGKKWDPETGWMGLSAAEARVVTRSSDVTAVAANNIGNDDVAITAESDLQDFGTLNQLDAIASQQDKSLQFLSEDEDGDGSGKDNDGDMSSSAGISKASGHYLQMADTGSVREYQRAAQSRTTVNVRRESINKDEADFFPEGSVHRGARKGPVDTDSIYEEEHYSAAGSTPREKPLVVRGPDANKLYQKLYEASNQGSFDDAAATDFSWDADEATAAMDNTLDQRRAVPRLKIKIRDAVAPSAPNSGRSTDNNKAQSEASFESAASSTIPKLAAPKRDTSPIRGGGGNRRTSSSIVTPPSEPFAETSGKNPLDDSYDDGQDAAEEERTAGEEPRREDQPIFQDYGPVEKLTPAKRLQTIGGGGDDDHAAEVARLVERITPTAAAAADDDPTGSKTPRVSELHKMWEKRTKSWDADPSRSDGNNPPLSPRQRAENSEWKSFLVKKVQAESAAASTAGRTESADDRDSVFDFETGSQTNKQQQQQQQQQQQPRFGGGDDLSELSPIRHDGSDSDATFPTRSEASTSVLQGTTFLQRLQACAAPIATRGAELARSSSQNLSCGAGEGAGPISAHLAFMRQNPTVGSSSPEKTATGSRPDVIPEDAATLDTEPSRSRSITPNKSRSVTPTKSRGGKPPPSSTSLLSRTRSGTSSQRDDLSSVVSDGFGSQSAYLEAIAMKAAVSGGSKKKKKRSSPSQQQQQQGGGPETAGSSRPGSEAGSAATGASTRSQKFQQFLDRRASKEASATAVASNQQQQQQQQRPPRRQQQPTDVKGGGVGGNNRGRAKEDYEETGAFPTLPAAAAGGGSHAIATRMAAEELAAARVEAMMHTLSTQNLEDNEGEI